MAKTKSTATGYYDRMNNQESTILSILAQGKSKSLNKVTQGKDMKNMM